MALSSGAKMLAFFVLPRESTHLSSLATSGTAWKNLPRPQS